MNQIPLGGVLYDVSWSIKVPFTHYWIVWLKGIHIIEVITKYWDGNGYYFNRIGFHKRPEYYASVPD